MTRSKVVFSSFFVELAGDILLRISMDACKFSSQQRLIQKRNLQANAAAPPCNRAWCQTRDAPLFRPGGADPRAKICRTSGEVGGLSSGDPLPVRGRGGLVAERSAKPVGML